jgi:hypothetical protein
MAGPQGLTTLDLKVPVKELVSHSITRLPNQAMPDLHKQWRESSGFVVHASQPKSDLPKGSLMKRCHFAGRCICSSDHGKHCARFVAEFEAAIRRVFPQPRQQNPERKQMRLLLKRGDVVVQMCGKSEDTVVHDVWYHIAYVNMNSWEMSLLRLEASTCPVHCNRVAPLKALQVPAEPSWACSHHTFAEVDLQLAWHVGVHTLIGDTYRGG